MQGVDFTEVFLRVLFTTLYKPIILVFMVLGIAGIANVLRSVTIKLYLKTIGYKAAKFIDTKLTFIGVIHHELSHLILGIITGAKICNVKLFKYDASKNQLGSVELIPRGPYIIRLIQIVLTAIAPTVCGCITVYIITTNIDIYSTEYSIALRSLVVFIVFCISYHMGMSKIDLKAALPGLFPIILVLSLLEDYITVDLEKIALNLAQILSILIFNIIILIILMVIKKLIH